MRAPTKLTPPRLGDTHPRERLFARLDAARSGAAIWITAPPGAGKTTLVASYLRARRLIAFWYQADAGRRDPATLFYLLRRAVSAARAARLPLFSPECLPELEGFARRFFRALFEARRHPLVLVFDNFHEMAPGSLLQGIVRAAIAEAPPGVCVIVISRNEPPAAFARLGVNQQLATLNWGDLRLDVAEATAIVTLHNPQATAHAAVLHRCANGWAAGVTLLLRTDIAGDGPAFSPEAGSRSADHSPASTAALGADVFGLGPMPQLLFDYLASEVYERASPGLRTLWLRTAQLPHFTAAMAAELSADPRAAKRIDGLWRRRYFIDRLAGAEAIYQYHVLLRNFLCQKLQRSLGVTAFRRQAIDAARLLERHGDVEEALALYTQSQEWQAASRLIVAQAKSLYAVGRVQTLGAWIDALPPIVAEQDAWLLFWRGCCDAHSGRVAASREHLSAASERFAALGDATGQCLAAAAMIESHFVDWNDFTGIDRWVLALQRLLPLQSSALTEPALELRVQAALLLALAYRTPQDASAPACAERVLQLCRCDIAPGARLGGATVLLQYRVQMESLAATAQLVAAFGPLARSPSTTVMQRVLWHWSTTRYMILNGQSGAVAEVFRETRELCTGNGLGHLVNFMRLLALWGVLAEGDVVAAAQELDDIGRTLDGLRPNDVALYHFMQAWIALLGHRPRAALDHAEIAARMALALGSAGPIICSCAVQSQALIGCDEAERALAVARVPQALVGAPGLGSFRFTVRFFEADALLKLGQHDECRNALRDAFATARASELLSAIVWLPDMAARLCAAALAADIETEYVERLIKMRHLLPPPGVDAERWPWPLRIHALGHFAVRVDGQLLESGAKAQRRPLELLKAIVVHGDHGVERAALLEQLWPDLDGDSARNAFDLALHRLRKLLAHGEVLILEDGWLRLDSRVVWVDACAFEQLCDRIETADRPPSELERLSYRLLQLYRGPLLAGEDQASVLMTRQRLHNRFERSVAILASELQCCARAMEALTLCRHATEIEPLSEPLQRALINAYRALGQFAEAAATYRQFRDLLAVTLGVAPALDTQALYRTLQET